MSEIGVFTRENACFLQFSIPDFQSRILANLADFHNDSKYFQRGIEQRFCMGRIGCLCRLNTGRFGRVYEGLQRVFSESSDR